MRRSILLCTALALATCVAAASAEPRRVDVFDDVGRLGGTDNDLPVGSGVTKDEAIGHAYTMPSVQRAIQEMLARGYVPHSAHDDAMLNYQPPVTVVVLAFEKPGLALPPDHVGAPAVVIGTSLDDQGFPRTSVSGGVVIVDTRTATFFTADSLPSLAQADASFDVLPGGGGIELGDGLKRWNGPGHPVSLRKKLERLVRCIYFGSLGILQRHLYAPPAGPPQARLASIIVQHLLLAAACAAAVFL